MSKFLISVSANELEAVDVDIRNLLTSIALANNLNIVISDEVQGNVSVKLLLIVSNIF